MYINIFLDPSVLWAPTVRTLSETSNDHALCCMLNHGTTVVQLLHCLSLSSCQLQSTLPSAAQLVLSQFNRATSSGIIYDFRKSLREFLDPLLNYFTRQTLPTVNRKHFINKIWIKSFCLQKTHNRTVLFDSTLKHGHHLNYWNQPLNMCMRVCYLGCHDT
jgi:hypothetical protein